MGVHVLCLAKAGSARADDIGSSWATAGILHVAWQIKVAHVAAASSSEQAMSSAADACLSEAGI